MNTFEKIIKDYVEKFAQGDAVFASKCEKPKSKKGSDDGLMMSLFDFAEE